jgi:hypothetical protein
VTGVAGDALGVVCGDDLGEGFGLGAVGLVTASTDDGGVELRGLDRCGIVGMFGLGAVAGFTGDDDVAALLFLVNNVGVAGLADLVTGVGDGAGGDLGNGVTAVVSVLAKAVGDDGGAKKDEGDQGDRHDSGEPDEVFNVLEQFGLSAPAAGALRGICAMILDTFESPEGR